MNRRFVALLCLAVLAAITWSLFLIPVAAEDAWSFRLTNEVCWVWINDDGSVWIDYDLTLSADAGSHALDIIDVGLPNSNYKLNEVSADVDGAKITDIRYSTIVKPGVEIHMGKFTIQPGASGSLHVRARAQQMVFQDTSDPEYAGMEFSPHYYTAPEAKGTTHVEVMIVFPVGVTKDETRYHAIQPTDSSIDADTGRAMYAWIKDSVPPGPQQVVGVSFPKKYLKSGLTLKVTPEPVSGGTSGGGSNLLDALCSGPVCVIAIGAGILILIGVASNASNKRKMKYLPPVLSVEGAGIKRGLTAVEAAILLEVPLNKVLTMMLFGLLKKGAVTVLTQDPLTLLKAVEVPADLHAYETGFLGCIEGQKLNEKALRAVVIDLIKAVNEKLKGFSRKETLAYYKDLVNRAWKDVEGAATPEVKSAKFDEQLEWTMMDDEWEKHVGQTFQNQPVFLPTWWGHYRPWATTSQPSQPTPQPVSTSSGPRPTPTMPTLPGAAFASTIVGGFQGVSNKVVSSLDRFTGGISAITNPPPPPPSSSGRRGGWSGGGGHSCACACACASCACACAGGGR